MSNAVNNVIDPELYASFDSSIGLRPVSENSQNSEMSVLKLTISSSRLVGSLFSNTPRKIGLPTSWHCGMISRSLISKNE